MKSPWGLSAKQNEVNGWAAITFCYKCTGNGFSKTAMVGYNIRQARDCNIYMEGAGSQPENPMFLSYNNSNTNEIIQI